MIQHLIDNRIPAGWVLSNLDCSRRPNKVSVMLNRDADGMSRWQNLPVEIAEKEHIYACGIGVTIEDALDNAAEQVQAYTAEAINNET